MSQKPSIGRIVHYVLAEGDAEQINRRYGDTQAHLNEHRQRADGSQVHYGNLVEEGRICAAVVVRDWNEPSGTVNLQVLLDGNDLYWATSRLPGDGPGTWHWPERVG